MHHAATGRHVLELTRADYAAATRVIPMFQGAFENPGKNFHVAVGMHGKTLGWRDHIFIDHA
jgi:hypothetical protein